MELLYGTRGLDQSFAEHEAGLEGVGWGGKEPLGDQPRQVCSPLKEEEAPNPLPTKCP